MKEKQMLIFQLTKGRVQNLALTPNCMEVGTLKPTWEPRAWFRAIFERFPQSSDLLIVTNIQAFICTPTFLRDTK